MIEKAVRLKPDDGYIVDSLGWAHYRLGNFKEAVKHLERAVELRPEDATLNDHLGDAYWRVGREREARFQWEQALYASARAGGRREDPPEAGEGPAALPPARTVKRKKGAPPRRPRQEQEAHRGQSQSAIPVLPVIARIR